MRFSNTSDLSGKTGVLFLGVLMFLALFQSSALLTLCYDFENQQIIQLAEGWHSFAQSVGAAGTTEMLSEFIAELHEIPVVE